MNVAELKDFCASLPGAVARESGHPSNVLVFRVGGKPFAWFKTSQPERWRFSFRVTPDRFLELTDQAGIKPARYMHRFHWVTVVRVAAMDADYLRELVAWSHQRALSTLPRTVQRAIAEAADSQASKESRVKAVPT